MSAKFQKKKLNIPWHGIIESDPRYRLTNEIIDAMFVRWIPRHVKLLSNKDAFDFADDLINEGENNAKVSG